MTDHATQHATHAAGAAGADGAAAAQTSGFAPAATDGQDTAQPALSRAPAWCIDRAVVLRRRVT